MSDRFLEHVLDEHDERPVDVVDQLQEFVEDTNLDIPIQRDGIKAFRASLVITLKRNQLLLHLRVSQNNSHEWDLLVSLGSRRSSPQRRQGRARRRQVEGGADEPRSSPRESVTTAAHVGELQRCPTTNRAWLRRPRPRPHPTPPSRRAHVRVRAIGQKEEDD
ncbi:hypothetical protein PR202_gb19945 [Eleusine coracana subsp. coracana]|uniref:Uncharacterized protein n=1 Tax=Eleusine coracana subsp. coracana TaxID=191504 RepID=A0AAV5F9H7_ELECO|nr:hypothetical protein PR202_gb19945 [Eleusine coracana subsp. coracana]